MLEVGGVAFTAAIATVVVLFYLVYSLIIKKSPSEDESASTDNNVETKEKSKSSQQQQQSKSKEKKPLVKPVKSKEALFKHRLLATTLKAHSDQVTGIDFSSNGKYLISCARDRALFMWSTKEFESPNHKSIRCNVEFDHAIKVRFSPDARAFIVGLGISNTIRAYKIVKKEDANVHIMQAAIEDFPKIHKADLINVGISCNGKFIMSCGQDTTINVWNVKGDLLGTVDSRCMNNSFATVSPCGRFFGVCGFTPDVKIWEVVFDKTDNFREIRRAFELKGHSAGVYSFGFNTDSTRMASVSKDQTWKLWNSDISYEKGQDAKELLSVELPSKGPSLIAISPDALTVAVAVLNTLYFYDAVTGKLDETIENFCTENPSEMSFSPDNKYLAVACDRHIKVFYNITGHRVAIVDFESKLKSSTKTTQAAKERMEQAIQEHKKSIESIEEKSKSSSA